MSYFIAAEDASRHEIFEGVHIATATGEAMTLSLVELQPGALVPWHSHPHEQMGILLEGSLTFWIGDEVRKLKPGDMWRIPGGVRHQAQAGPEPTKALDVFHPVRQEYA